MKNFSIDDLEMQRGAQGERKDKQYQSVFIRIAVSIGSLLHATCRNRHESNLEARARAELAKATRAVEAPTNRWAWNLTRLSVKEYERTAARIKFYTARVAAFEMSSLVSPLWHVR